jgi:Tfp pilus assembly protein PilF
MHDARFRIWDAGCTIIDKSNLAVQEACIKARHLCGNLKPEALAQAPKCLERAIELAPDYELAHCGLANHYFKNGAGGNELFAGAGSSKRVTPDIL